MIKLCLFDLDGTLLDTLTQIQYYLNKTLKLYGFSELPLDRVRKIVGYGGRNLIESALNLSGRNRAEEPWLYEEFFEKYLKLYNSDANYLVAPYDGIYQALDYLKSRGVKLAVVSNKPHSTVVLVVRKFFGDSFDVVIGGRDGIPLKPAADMPLLACEALGISPSETAFIGDTEVDMHTARAYGASAAVGVLWGFRDRETVAKAGADYLIESPYELIELFEKIL